MTRAHVEDADMHNFLPVQAFHKHHVSRHELQFSATAGQMMQHHQQTDGCDGWMECTSQSFELKTCQSALMQTLFAHVAAFCMFIMP